ncbi:hypothetical protein [Nannocystis punicea]|uniref:Uncharacterized protein n=1 Tax=Nannocystis punicea TaxID=2995304 RepID=A0ABY7HBM2_9BACT|nr:hypothetical protein [Nannocystis poenicansa]WAS96675.1 hypothetical protein O0S08_11035 [Nannocystis poenicansa]
MNVALDIEDMPPRPVGSPVDFFERLSLALKTTDATVLDAAARDFRGIYQSAHEYISNQVAEHLPPFLGWLPASCDPGRLREGYEAGKILVWVVPLEENRVMVFESLRESFAVLKLA